MQQVNRRPSSSLGSTDAGPTKVSAGFKGFSHVPQNDLRLNQSFPIESIMFLSTGCLTNGSLFAKIQIKAYPTPIIRHEFLDLKWQGGGGKGTHNSKLQPDYLEP